MFCIPSRLLLFTLFLALSLVSSAQETTCQLFGPDGEPIPYASVHFPDMKRGVLTDENGTFNLNLEGGATASEITFSCLNFESEIRTVSELRDQSGPNCKIVLENADYQLQIAEVTGQRIRMRQRKIGAYKGVDNASFDFLRTNRPVEIGTIMDVRKRCRIDNVNIRIHEMEADSFLIEVSLYDYADRGNVGKMLLRERVIRTLTQAETGEEYTVDLADQNVWVEEDFLVAYRMIPTDNSGGRVEMAARTKSGKGLLTNGDGRWMDSYLYPAIWAEVSYPE